MAESEATVQELADDVARTLADLTRAQVQAAFLVAECANLGRREGMLQAARNILESEAKLEVLQAGYRECTAGLAERLAARDKAARRPIARIWRLLGQLRGGKG